MVYHIQEPLYGDDNLSSGDSVHSWIIGNYTGFYGCIWLCIMRICNPGNLLGEDQ